MTTFVKSIPMFKPESVPRLSETSHKVAAPPYFSTSESAEKVRDMKNSHIGAIANKTAAKLYELDVLAESINDNTQNYTRFFIITADREEVSEADKITLVLTTQHRPAPCITSWATFSTTV